MHKLFQLVKLLKNNVVGIEIVYVISIIFAITFGVVDNMNQWITMGSPFCSEMEE